MRGRCYLRVRTLKAHAPLFEELGMMREDEDEPHEVVLVDEEANDGLGDELEHLAKRGVVFLAEHGAGAQHGPALVASDGSGELVTVEASWDGYPVVRCDTDPAHPVREELANLEKYVETHKRAEAIIAGKAERPRYCRACGGDLGLTADQAYGTQTCGTCAASRHRYRERGVVMTADWLTDIASVLDRLEEMLERLSGDGRLSFYARDLTRLVAWLRTQPRTRVFLLGALGAGVLVGAIALSTRKEPDAPE